MVRSLWLALRLERPLLVEGPPGAGKTELALSAAAALGRPLIRLQCYEGLDQARALYDWDRAKQALFTQLLRDVVARDIGPATSVSDAVARTAANTDTFYNERFLVARPVLQALESAIPAVLLVDGIDRANPEFEALLLESLAEYQVSIPELGTVVVAKHKPLVVLTIDGTRDVTDALRRRCLHVFLEYPGPAEEAAIVRARVPQLDEGLLREIVIFVQGLRDIELRKTPSVAETLDWARGLLALGAQSLNPELVGGTLSVLIKHKADLRRLEGEIARLVDLAKAP